MIGGNSSLEEIGTYLGFQKIKNTANLFIATFCFALFDTLACNTLGPARRRKGPNALNNTIFLQILL